MLNTSRSILYTHAPWFLLLAFGVHMTLFWPGQLLPDSSGQLHEAMAGVYSDHHPPLMAFIWRYLLKILPAQSSMFILQLSLFYTALFFFINAVKNLRLVQQRPWLLLLLILMPFYPQVLSYSFLIQKDNHFAFSYMLILAVLSERQLQGKTLSWPHFTVLLPLLIYGTAVKFQAKYCAVIVIVWLAWHLVQKGTSQKPTFLKISLASLFIAFGVYGSMGLIHKSLVPKSQENKSWQLVKLYDLAAISIENGEDLIPPFNKSSTYTFEALKQRFSPNHVDPLIFPSDRVLEKCKTDQQLDILWNTWFNAIKKHPFSYLKHRARNMGYLLLSRVGYDMANSFIDEHFKTPLSQKMAHIAASAFYYIFMSHFLTVLLGCVYLVLGLRAWSFSPTAPLLVGINGIGLLLVGIFLFFSMAGVPRYTYTTILFIHCTHILAWATWKEWRSRPLKK